MNEINTRANARSAVRKRRQDAEVASKTKRGGLLIVYTGAGKGKSTAAFGLMARALGHGMKVAVIQFTKGKWKTGERHYFGKQIEFHSMGQGFTWETQDRAKDIEHAKKAWQKGVEIMQRVDEDACQMIIFDELNHILRYGYLDEEEVLTALASRPPHLHVVVTGRAHRDN